jgi:hypothetical protein
VIGEGVVGDEENDEGMGWDGGDVRMDEEMAELS